MGNVLSHSFTAVGQSAAMIAFGRFNVSVQGVSGSTIDLERSFDNGSTWEVVEAVSANVSTTLLEPETHVKYRFNCTAFGTGTVTCRLGASGRY